MKTINNYIQFAMDNGFNVQEYCLTSDNVKNWAKKGYEATATVSDIEMITSLKFLEAIARGVVKNGEIKQDKVNGQDYIDTPIGSIYVKDNLKFVPLLENTLTKQQAIAIRDNKLEEFINKIL